MANPLKEILTVRFTKEEREEIRIAADKDGVPESLWIRQRIRASLRGIKAKALA